MASEMQRHENEHGVYRAHKTAEVEEGAVIGNGVTIWAWTHVRERAIIGSNTILAERVYIGEDVEVGANVKIQNNVSVYKGVRLEDGVFVGPHVVFTNDVYPRAITPEGRLLQADEWYIKGTLVEYGASLGANSSIKAGVTIGRWALVGMGSVVVKDIPEYGLAVGNPAEVVGTVDDSGKIIDRFNSSE